jgi:23S rRNA (guanosine2251-2'-O)-methyltransferase
MARDRPPRRRRGPAAPASPAARRAGEHQPRNKAWLYGRHAVAAALQNPQRRWSRLAALPGQEAEAKALIAAAVAPRRGDGEAVALLDREALAALLPPGAVHQGLALEAEPLAPPDLEGLLHAAGRAPTPVVVLALDQVADPQNVGAVLRAAAAYGALCVIEAAAGAPPVSGALAKAASGALEAVPLIRVVNLARALDRLKTAGFWLCGLDEQAPQALPGLDLGERIALVLGAEGKGLRRLTREHCDHLAHLPTRTRRATLNVAAAAAIALYEATRARDPG